MCSVQERHDDFGECAQVAAFEELGTEFVADDDSALGTEYDSGIGKAHQGLLSGL
ncbi:hypothetical protein [Streptomyces lavendulae]|uniref:hypothetical protein n=1 Tax=Streptomyces lavendulae TaxID=1914 RepID=UPI0033E526AA